MIKDLLSIMTTRRPIIFLCNASPSEKTNFFYLYTSLLKSSVCIIVGIVVGLLFVVSDLLAPSESLGLSSVPIPISCDEKRH